MTEAQRTSQGEALTQVILLIFRADGLLIRAGDVLASEEQLTSARWQVLGALAMAGGPLTVPQIARRMGLTRQSVHATVHRLVEDELVLLRHNADHRRSPLVRLTDRGAAMYSAVDARQAGWSNKLAEKLDVAHLRATAETLSELCARLEAEVPSTTGDRRLVHDD